MGRVVELGISGGKCLNCQITCLLAILIGFSTRISHIPERVFPRPERVIILSSFLCICEVLYTKTLFFTSVSLVPIAYFYCACVLLPIRLTWKSVSSTCWLRSVLGVGYWTLAPVDESDADCGVGRNFAQVMHNMAERFFRDRFKTAAGFLFWALLGHSHAPFWLLHLLQEWAWKEWGKKMQKLSATYLEHSWNCCRLLMMQEVVLAVHTHQFYVMSGATHQLGHHFTVRICLDL